MRRPEPPRHANSFRSTGANGHHLGLGLRWSGQPKREWFGDRYAIGCCSASLRSSGRSLERFTNTAQHPCVSRNDGRFRHCAIDSQRPPLLFRGGNANTLAPTIQRVHHPARWSRALRRPFAAKVRSRSTTCGRRGGPRVASLRLSPRVPPRPARAFTGPAGPGSARGAPLWSPRHRAASSATPSSHASP